MPKEFSNVVPLYKNDVVEMLETLLEMAKAGKIKNFIAAGHLDDGNIFTSVVKTNVIEHHILNSYLQSNVILRTIEQNNM